jgi:indolepyruvate ferredoxin oxidoreductase alpha subunit
LREHPLLRPRGSRVLLLGNEAIARGALEAGMCFATAYPGTPSTEIVEVLSEVARECGVYVEWSVNEKVAFEAAYGAAIAGVRSLTAMKHVGLNVAADILMSSAYAGVEEGFVVVTADDPSAHSSQNEQDNRWYGLLAHLPVLEPSSAREAYKLVKEAFNLSTRYKIPVIFRSTTRISHTRMPVELEDDIPLNEKCKGTFTRDYERWVLVPVHTRRRKLELIKTWKALSEEERFVTIHNPGKEKVIVSSGLAHSYVREVLEALNLLDRVTLVKVNMPVPLPRKPLLSVLEHAKEILVVEELDPVVEMQLKDLVVTGGYRVAVRGKDLVPENYELTPEAVYRAVAKFIGIEEKLPWEGLEPVKLDPPIPPRPPVLCAGCPHRSTYYALKVAANRAGIRDVIYTGDIGCYTLGYQKPFETQMTCFEMGGSIGVAHGLAKVTNSALIAVIGDSTFFHAGIPPALNVVYNNSSVLVLVLDNITTAMTGHQPHPGTGVTAMSEPTTRIMPETVLSALGFKVYTVYPLDVKKAIEDFTKALEDYKRGEKVAIVSRMRCALEVLRDARRRGVVLPIYTVLEEKCTGCMACVKLTACPAIIAEPGSKKPRIERALCAGCGLCAAICPYKAIVIANKPGEDWVKVWTSL